MWTGSSGLRAKNRFMLGRVCRKNYNSHARLSQRCLERCLGNALANIVGTVRFLFVLKSVVGNEVFGDMLRSFLKKLHGKL